MKIQIQIKIRKNAFTSPGSCLHQEQANAPWSQREAASSPQNLSRVVGFLSQQIPGVASEPQKRSERKSSNRSAVVHLRDRLLGVGQHLDHPAEARPLLHSLPHLQKKSVRKNFFKASVPPSASPSRPWRTSPAQFCDERGIFELLTGPGRSSCTGS